MDNIHRFITVVYFVVFVTGNNTSLIYYFWFPTFHSSCELCLALSTSLVGVIYIKYRQRNPVGDSQEFKFNSLCYFMAIAVSGTILRVNFILNDIAGMRMLTSCLGFYGISVSSRIVFLEIGVKIGRFNLQHHKKLIIASTVFHIVITVAFVTAYIRYTDATFEATMIEPEDASKKRTAWVWSQLGLAILSGVSTTEFLVVLTGGFRSLHSDSSDMRELNTERTDSDPIIECNICLTEFSASRVPRILKKCGHTICEYCADRIIRNGKIACPACQTVTEVDVCYVLSALLVKAMIGYFYAKYRQRNRVDEFQEFTFDLWSHFLGIASFGTILRVIFILIDVRDTIMLTSCLAFYCTTLCFRAAVIEIGEKIGRFDLQHHKKLIIASTVFHVGITGATVKATMIWLNVKEINLLVWSQLGLATVSGVSIIEFLVVLTGGFRSLKSDPSDIRELNTERTDSDPIIECKICLIEFSASRIPRILENCGHTICEYCADRIIRNGRISCPACQTVTVVDGPVSKLTKNHDVLEFVEGIKME
ncbi:hypothetical protein CRE_10619 [Caenorhabditis remanei]|uniref:RING-type domain-containing protein n=1 Tax=Caenorhabditis remanei TaxID=31234 RepID=E3NBJ6_CAERE|nr:hypothetical protein CRE_10619 [Caenorhabditis remanei]